MKPAHIGAGYRAPEKSPGFNCAAPHWTECKKPQAHARRIVNRSDIGAGHAIMLERFVEGDHAHGPNPFGDQIANWISGDCCDNAGEETEAVREVSGYVEVTTADMDLALVRLAEWNYAWVQAMYQRAQSQKVQGCRLTNR